MADRYWVGGTGTWNTTSTTNWSASSGGASGASVPTASDNVFFDQNTTYTVTLTGALACLSLNVSQGTVTFTSSGTLAVSGSFTIKTGTVWSANGAITFNATSSQTITTNGVTLSAAITINGVGGTFALGSALTCGGLTLTEGTFSTSASNYNLTGNITISANSNTKQLDLNASTVTSGFANNSTGNFTLNEGTSTIVLASTRSITGNAETFYNISATNFGTFGSPYVNGLSINGSTFNNGTFNASDALTSVVHFTGNPTFNGTLTTTSVNPWDRVLFSSNLPGTTRTITAATRNLTDADFQDITAGGGTSWTGTRLGDGGGNSNITFDAAKNVFYVAATAGSYKDSKWATTSGGATSSANYPMLQDTAYFDNNSGTGTFDTGTAGVSNLTFANRTTAITWNPCPTNSYQTAWFGSVTASNSVTISTSGYGITVRPSGNKTINLLNKFLNAPLYIQADENNSRDISLAGNFQSGQFFHSYGTLKLNSYTLSLDQFYNSNATTIRTLNFGTGNITLTSSGNKWSVNYTNLTISGTPIVNVSNTGAGATTVSTGTPSTSQLIDFNFTSGTYTLTISGRYNNLDFTGFSGAFSNSGVTVYGNFKASTGMSFSASVNAITFAATSGTKTITSNGRTIDCPVTFDGVGGTWSLQDNTTIGTTRTVTLTNGSLLLNTRTLTCGLFASSNSNVRTLDFGTGKIVVNSTGTLWNTGTVTNLTVSGTPVVDVNNNTATATTISPGALSEANSISFNFISGTYALTLNNNYRNVNFTGFAGTLGTQARTVYGDWTISTGMTLSAGTQTLTFAATSGSKTITSNGKTFDFPVTFNGIGGTWVLQDNLTVGTGRVVTHTNGTLDLNGKTLNSGIRYLTAVGTKNLTFNGGTLLCSQANTTAFNNAQPTGFTTTAGTGVGKISMSAATAKTFVGGGSTYNCTLSNDGAGALTISGSNTFTTLANGVQPTTFTFTSGTTTTVTNWNISGTAGNLVTIGSTTTSQHTLSDASGIVNANYLSISYSNATGGATWYAGANSTDGGNNTGWIFSGPTSGNFFLLFN